MTDEIERDIRDDVMTLQSNGSLWVLADDYRALLARAEEAEAKLAAAREALHAINDAVNWEINPSNYTHEQVCDMNRDWCAIGNRAESTLARIDADAPARPAPVTVEEAALRIMLSSKARDTAFDAMWKVAEKHSLEATNQGGARYSITGDVVNELYYAALRALAGENGDD